jgi:nucleoside-diphosphate-sugar epimerase
MTDTVLILGANGHLGRAVAIAFARAGWRVLAQVRRAGEPIAGDVHWLSCDARDVAALVRSGQGARVVVNGLNPPYTRWEREALPLAQAAIDVALGLGATLMLPGNVYVFGDRMPAVLDEATPFRPSTSKGRIRVAIEQAMRAAADQGLRSVVIRAGDFYGGGPGNWFDQAITARLAAGRVTWPGELDAMHAWAWLPDLAEVFVRVAQVRERLETSAVLHYPGHALTGRELVAAIERAAGRPLKVGRLPWALMRVLSPVVPMWRALLEMRYLWQVPHRLSGERLAAAIGEVPVTPLAITLADALGPRAAAAGPVLAQGDIRMVR